MRRLMGVVAASVALAAAGPGCETTPSAEALLVVQAAQEQPGADALGIIVVVQSLGGAWLEFDVAGGTLAGGGNTACLPAPDSGSLRDNTLDVLVYPAQVEAVVTVRLFASAPRVVAGEAGAGDDGSVSGLTKLGACGIAARPLREVIRPVQRITAVPPNTGGFAGSTWAGGKSGVGGSGTGGAGGVAGTGALGGIGGVLETGGASGNGSGGEPEAGASGAAAASGETGGAP